MKNSKKGISLIVLIITIIVIIILATAILVSVINNNPISEANEAKFENDCTNMQALLTTTISKIATENLGTVTIYEWQLNKQTSRVNETIGEVAYTVKSRVSSENKNGKIIFDKGENTSTVYYTGKKLPIYPSGQTKWYVDSKGILSLEVAGIKYGNAEEYSLEAGVYTDSGIKKYTWNELLYTKVKCDGCSLVNNVLNEIESEEYKIITCNTYDDMCTFSKTNTFLDGVLVFPKYEKIAIDILGFYKCENITSIILFDNITKINNGAFYKCEKLSNIIYSGTVEQWNNIEFGNYWNADCPEITVHCLDGDITVPVYEIE